MGQGSNADPQAPLKDAKTGQHGSYMFPVFSTDEGWMKRTLPYEMLPGRRLWLARSEHEQKSRKFREESLPRWVAPVVKNRDSIPRNNEYFFSDRLRGQRRKSKAQAFI